MLNNIVNFKLLVPKPAGIHTYEKCIKYPGGHARRHVFMACSKLEARGHLLHKTGTPPKHFSRECNYYDASGSNWFRSFFGRIEDPPK